MAEKERKPPMGGMRPGPKGRGAVETTKKLIKNYLANYKISLMIVFIFAVGSTIFSVIGPKILGNATTEIYTGLIGKIYGTGGINFEKIANILLTLLALYIASAAFSIIQGFTMTGIAQKLTYKLRSDLTKKINRLPMNYFDKSIICFNK